MGGENDEILIVTYFCSRLMHLSQYRDPTDNVPPGVFQSAIENNFVHIIFSFRPDFFTNCLSFRLISWMLPTYLRKSQYLDLDSFFNWPWRQKMRQSGAALGGLCFCFVVHDYKSYYKWGMSRCWYFCFKKRRPRRFKRQKRDFLRWAFKNGPDKLEIVKIGGLSWELGVAQKSVEMEHYLSGHGSSSELLKTCSFKTKSEVH